MQLNLSSMVHENLAPLPDKVNLRCSTHFKEVETKETLVAE